MHSFSCDPRFELCRPDLAVGLYCLPRAVLQYGLPIFVHGWCDLNLIYEPKKVPIYVRPLAPVASKTESTRIMLVTRRIDYDFDNLL